MIKINMIKNIKLSKYDKKYHENKGFRWLSKCVLAE